MKNINIRPESVKLLGKNIGEKLLDVEHSNYFWESCQKCRAQRQKWTKLKYKALNTEESNQGNVMTAYRLK
jgi:predicted nucleic-acid-binding Zn-ribbon protein